MENMLEIKDLHVYYDNIHALKGISLNVKQGEIVSLIGANGAGKTTTLQTISGLIQSKLGNIMFEGKDITKKSHIKYVKLELLKFQREEEYFQDF